MLSEPMVTFAGNLAADPRLHFTTGGTAIAEFRVLVNHVRPDPVNKRFIDAEPTAFTCEAWSTLAQNIVDSITKGDRVLVHGRIRTDDWNDKTSGKKRIRDIVQVDALGPDLAGATATPTRNPRKNQPNTDAGEPTTT